MMLIRMGKKLRRKAKAEEADPFAPEMGTDSWFKTQQAINGGKVGMGRRKGERGVIHVIDCFLFLWGYRC